MEELEMFVVLAKILVTILGITGFLGVAIVIVFFLFSDFFENILHFKALLELITLLGSPIGVILVIGGIVGLFLGDRSSLPSLLESFVGGAATFFGLLIIGSIIVYFIILGVKKLMHS